MFSFTAQRVFLATTRCGYKNMCSHNWTIRCGSYISDHKLKDNKLREFGYKILHRILVTNKELKKFKIRNDDLSDQCKTPDSLEHTVLQCPANVKFYHEILSWFNVSHNTLINLSPEQILMQKYVPGPINDNLRRRLDLLILFIKKYVYSCKINVVPLNCMQFINNLKTQWKTERLT